MSAGSTIVAPGLSRLEGSFGAHVVPAVIVHNAQQADSVEAPLDKWIARAIMGSVICSIATVAGTSIFLGLAVVLWTVGAIRSRRVVLRFPPFGKILLVFMGAVVVSVVFSSDPWFSLGYLKKFVRFLGVGFIFTYLDRRRIETTLKGTLLLLTLSALLGICQFYWLIEVDLLNRIRGFMSHWMTFSGQLMMGVVAVAGLVFLSRLGRPGRRPGEAAPLMGHSLFLWGGVLALLMMALLLTLTRNAWLGAIFGLLCWLLILRWRWVILFFVGLGLLYLLLPAVFHQRVSDGFNRNDTTTRTRLELLVTGGRMISAHPVTGVGPRMVPRLADRYRSHREFPDWLYQHLHNAPLQVAAAMGIPALLVWLSLWLYLIRDFWRLARFSPGSDGPDPMLRFLGLNGICVIVAFLAAGLLENNFGDSELVTLLMFFITAPYVYARGAREAR